MKKVIKCTDLNGWFKQFSPEGGLTFTKDIEKALDISADSSICRESNLKRMVAAWYGKPFNKCGLIVEEINN